MKLVNIKKDQLNNFVKKQKGAQFLQSWEWGDFQEGVGSEVMRLGVEDNGKIIFATLVIKKLLPMGRSYFYCPRIHVTKNKEHVTKFFFEELKKIAKKDKVIFFRFDPITSLESKSYESCRLNNGLQIKKTIDVQPSKTLVLDLQKGEEELLKEMHQKTRYNIRLSEKRGVDIFQAGVEKFDDFWKLMSETKERDQFRLHGREYYRKMIKESDGMIKLFFAKYDDKLIATGIFSFFGDTVTYLHGASSNEYRNVMAPYGLQWHVIELGIKLEYKYYDFYGIDKKKWPGVTRFKTGFGGKEIQYPGTFDLVFNKTWYNVYQFIRRLRRK